jgi:two-component system chemotaxis sensor kinase CheA
MTGVTHVLEGLLDRLRKEELPCARRWWTPFWPPATSCGPSSSITRAGRKPMPAASRKSATGSPGSPPVTPRLRRPWPGAVRRAGPRPRSVCLFPPDLADSGEAVDNFLAALAEIAALDIRHRPDAANGLLEARLTTSLSDAELRDALAFYLAPEDISLAPATDREDAAYGLFDDAPENAASGRGRGLRLLHRRGTRPGRSGVRVLPPGTGASAPPLATESGDGAFGLFEDAPGAPESPAHREISPAGSPAAVEGQGYGLFPDAPGGRGFQRAAERLTPSPPGKPEASPPAVSPGRRLSDNPGIEIARSGRRDNDKTVVAAGADTSIRVSVEKVDQLINLVGELVITQAMLAETAGGLDPIEAEKLLAGIDLLSRNTRDLQESVMSIRMLPMSMVFSRFPRVVRDLAGKLNKQVEMKTIGENTELDKGLIEKITDPLTHLVRNSLDHGIETPDKRVAAGKNPKGTLTLKASHQGGAVVIEVMDDGGGLNRARILEKARERGLAVSDAMSDHEVWQLIFAPGFSTADVVTDVSGRGVGMDVVKRNIEGLGGKVELESSPGFGTRTVIRLPLTLAILDGMSVGVGGETFIVPITTVVESLQPSLDDIRTLAGDSRMIHIRGEYLPFIALAEVFGLPGVEDITRGLVVVVEGEEGRAALFVDELLGQHQVVIKSLEANYRKVPGMSGATIMGDGRVALILDVAAAIRLGLASGRRRAAA